MRTAPARLSLERLGIDSSRKMPAYERDTFRDWWGRRPAVRRSAPRRAGDARDEPPTGRVALFVDCFINHNLPQVGRAAVEVLEHAGLEVVIAHNSCCGRAALSQGLLGKPRDWAVKNLAELGRLVDEGYDIVFIEPSCLSAVRDDYARLLEATHADDDRLRRIQEHSYDITEYLVMRARAGQLDVALGALPETYVVHGHCHQKSLGIGSVPAELLRLIPGVTVHEVEALCCGMVGSFGYKKEYSRSLTRDRGPALRTDRTARRGCRRLRHLVPLPDRDGDRTTGGASGGGDGEGSEAARLIVRRGGGPRSRWSAESVARGVGGISHAFVPSWVA